MGFFDFFSGGLSTPENEAEKEAMKDYVVDVVETKNDPIPNKIPDWAENLPEPKK